MIEYPQRKVTLYTIPTKYWKATFRLQQATASETNDYYYILKQIRDWKEWRGEELHKYFYNKLKDNVKSYEKPINIRKTRILSLIKLELALYYTDLANILHPTRESKFIWLSEPVRKEEIKKWKRKQIFQSDLELIYDKTGVSVNEVESTFTMEQIGWWIDKIRFDYYESFDEGQKVNNQIKARIWLSDSQKELLKKIKENSVKSK